MDARGRYRETEKKRERERERERERLPPRDKGKFVGQRGVIDRREEGGRNARLEEREKNRFRSVTVN